MYHAASGETAGGWTKCSIDLPQLIVSTYEMRGEDIVRQLTDSRREPVVCVPLAAFPVHNIAL